MLAGFLAAAALPMLLAAYLFAGLYKGGEWLMDQYLKRRHDQQARIEAELDRTQDELRASVLRLATALGVEQHEARKALIRESCLASGRVPPAHDDSNS